MKLSQRIDRSLHTELMIRDLYKAACLLALGGKILAISRYWPVMRLNLRVNKLALWYVDKVGVLPYKRVQTGREYLKSLARERKPTKEELKVRRLYRRHFYETKSSNV